eukprot:1988113-Rhodomonas_salina.1
MDVTGGRSVGWRELVIKKEAVLLQIPRGGVQVVVSSGKVVLARVHGTTFLCRSLDRESLQTVSCIAFRKPCQLGVALCTGWYKDFVLTSGALVCLACAMPRNSANTMPCVRRAPPTGYGEDASNKVRARLD